MASSVVAESRSAIERAESSRSSVLTLLANPWVIAGFALVGRLMFMAIMRTWDFKSDFHNFQFGYETGSIARSIAAGHGFGSPFRNVDTGPTAWIAPVYPYLCAAVFKLFGIFTAPSAIVILAINSLASALTIVPLLHIAQRLFGKPTAIVAAWMWAVVPYLMIWPAGFVWEVAFSALLATSLISFALGLTYAPTRRWFCFGSLGGVALLTNPALLTVLPIASLWAVWRSPFRKTTLKRALLAGVMCVVVISPWLVRNRVVLGKWVFIRDNFNFEFSIGNYPGGSGMGWGGLHPVENKNLMSEYATNGELAFLAARAQYPRMWVTQHTSEFVRTTGRRFVAFWDGDSLHYAAFSCDIWKPATFLTVSVLALLGCLLAMGTQVPGAGLLALVCLLYPWPYYITYPQTRYRHAVEPLMVVFIAYFAVVLAKRIEERWKSFRKDAIAN